MDDERRHPAVARVRREHAVDEALDLLGGRLPGADLTAVLLDVMDRRAGALVAADVLAQYERDRFVRPATVDTIRLLEFELLAMKSLDDRFTPVTTAPLMPLGSHSVVAGVQQNRVVTTVRGTEVAADPTNALALEAAVARRSLIASNSRSSEMVHLAAADRVVRAQRFDGPRSFAHFALLGLVSAGRDIGSHRFEREAFELHVLQLATIVRNAGCPVVNVALTDFGGRHHDVVDSLASSLAAAGVSCTRDPERIAARAYYPNLCFKLNVDIDGEHVELADGGIVAWTQALVGSKKERLMISGLSLERLTMVAPTSAGRA